MTVDDLLSYHLLSCSCCSLLVNPARCATPQILHMLMTDQGLPVWLEPMVMIDFAVMTLRSGQRLRISENLVSKRQPRTESKAVVGFRPTV